MRRLLVVAACVAVLAAGGAFAGEVKGPPGTPNNTNETGALDHASSACAASGLNDMDEHEGQSVSLEGPYMRRYLKDLGASPMTGLTRKAPRCTELD